MCYSVRNLVKLLLKSLVVTLFIACQAPAQTIKELTNIEGVRTNQLIGYGLVVGLDGTGDLSNQTPFTAQSFNNLLKNFGIKMPDNLNRMQLKNIAAVAVTAEFPAFAKLGQQIDVTVSSIGNAKSLRGGNLLLTELKGIDGQTYALAQGNLLVSGINAEAGKANKISINSSSVGLIPSGATIEQELTNDFSAQNVIHLNLHKASFSTAQNIVSAINKKFGHNTAYALDAGTIEIPIKQAHHQTGETNEINKIAFIAELENIPVKTAQETAKVIINSRSGTVVINQNVRVSAASVTHGNLSVTITQNTNKTNVAGMVNNTSKQTNISINERSKNVQFETAADLNTIVQNIKQLGAAPSDLIAILQALKEAGALQAQLIVI